MFDIGLDKSILSVTALSHVLSKDDFARRTASNAINPAPPIAPAIIQFFVNKYTGKERRKAIEDFEQLQKEKKNTIFEKDIEKRYWER